MTTALPKGSSTVTSSYPRTFSSIFLLICGLAVFLVVASFLLAPRPIGSTVRGYFYDLDQSKKNDIVDGIVSNSSLVRGNNSFGTEKRDDHSRFLDKDKIKDLSERGTPTEEKLDDGGEKPADAPNVTNGVEKDLILGPSLQNSTNIVQLESIAPSSYSMPDVVRDKDSMDTGCDLFHGEWVYDSKGPLYTNNSCPVLTQMQNCQGNGRPDKDYENWRWKPAKCDLPRFDAKKFLELMKGKTLAFIGDSVARNQMESLMCILWQVEVPKNRGNKKMQRFVFRSTSTMIVRIWSSWLVHQTSEPFAFAPEGVMKLHLDLPDETFMQLIPGFDVVVLASGHWFAKQSVYILNNEIVGGQLWWPDKSRVMKLNNVEAFGISTETILTAMATHPNYTGLTIVRSFSPDHYEGGAWNTGGSCTGKTKPALDGEVVENGFTDIMHEKQVNGFSKAVEKAEDKSRLELLDITKIFAYRHDGHPGPYRNPDPNKITKRGPDGRPPPQDCLHWCMPGPIDTWNEMVLETIRRKFET